MPTAQPIAKGAEATRSPSMRASARSRSSRWLMVRNSCALTIASTNATPSDHGLAVRHRRHGIGADDPARLDLPGGHFLEHVDGAGADLAADRAGLEAPRPLDERAVVRLGHRALSRQPGSHVSHLAAAHG